MKAEIKDPDKIVCVALRAVGFNVNTHDTEKILNIVDLIRQSKKDVTLKDVMEVSALVDSLFQE